MASISTLLKAARDVGLEVRVETDDLIVRGPQRYAAVAQQILQQKQAVLALLAAEDAETAWRIAAMRPQVPKSGPIPFLVARPDPPMRGRCLSCGDPLVPGKTIRCEPCARAAQLVLTELREDLQPP